MKLHFTQRLKSFFAVFVCMFIQLTLTIGQGPTSTDIQTRFYAVDEFSSIDLSGNEIIYRDARYIGGMKALRQHLKDNVVYPENSIMSENSGKILVRCTIGSDGSVTNAIIERSINPQVDSAILDAVLTMPLWEPAIQYGRPIASTLVIPYKVR